MCSGRQGTLLWGEWACEWEGNLCPRTWTGGAATERVRCICAVFASVRGGLLTASPLSWGPRLLACGLSASRACGLCFLYSRLHVRPGPGLSKRQRASPTCGTSRCSHSASVFFYLQGLRIGVGWGGACRSGSSSVSVFQVTCPAAASWMTIRSSPVLGTPPGEHLSHRAFLTVLALDV